MEELVAKLPYRQGGIRARTIGSTTPLQTPYRESPCSLRWGSYRCGYLRRVRRREPLSLPNIRSIPDRFSQIFSTDWWASFKAVNPVGLSSTCRYPKDIFELVIGIKWRTLRVAAYAVLMLDEYPSVRLAP